MSLIRAPRAALDAARAIATVVAVRRMIAGRPIGALVAHELAQPAAAAGGGAPAGAGGGATPPRRADARDEVRTARLVGRWRAAVDRALALAPGDRGCLVRATALQRRLRAAGLEATVRIGVRRTEGALDAHAWVELAGRPVGEPAEHVAAFAPLDGLTLR